MTRALFGYSIDTEADLHRARPGPNGRGTLAIGCTEDELLSRQGELVSWDDRDDLQFALATSGRDLLAWCSITGTYVISGDQGRILARPDGGREHWEHRLGATIVPLALSERGDLALHAAALADEEGAVLLCGPPGRGKSTAAAALALRGLEVLSEDGVIISEADGQPLAWPGQAGVRIPAGVLRAVRDGDASQATDCLKTTQLMERSQTEGPAAVRAVILLAELGGAHPELERLDPVAALPSLMPYALYGGPSRLREVLHRTARLAERVPVYRGRLPRDLTCAGEYAHALLRLVLSR